MQLTLLYTHALLVYTLDRKADGRHCLAESCCNNFKVSLARCCSDTVLMSACFA